MAKVKKTMCTVCKGEGTLPPLGGDGPDVKRFFPRPCDACNCSRFVYIEKEILETEKKNDGNVATSDYIPGQGDC